jgi:hypothetical protein
MRPFRWLFELAALVFCGSLIWATAIHTGLNHNEQMYVAAARLWWRFRLYSDYAYLQAPLLPIVNAGLFAIAGHEHLLLIARLHVAFWSLVAVGSAYELGRRLSGGWRAVGLGAAIALCSHRVFLSNVAESSNYMMPLALAMLSLLGIVIAVDETAAGRRTAIWCGCSGLAIGLAVSCKSFYVLPALGLGAMAFACNRAFVRHWLAGAAIGVLPILFYAVGDPSGFYFGNLGYHFANTKYRRVTGSTLPMDNTEKLRFLRNMWAQPFLISVTGYAVSAFLFLHHGALATQPGRIFAIAWPLTLFACSAALLPTPSYVQYFAAPFAFLLMTAIAATGLRAGLWRSAFVALCVLGAAVAPSTRGLAKSLQRSSAPARVEAEAKKLRQHIRCARETYVATLSPILPLEAGCSIYPELATGPFAFRVADESPRHVQADLNLIGSSRLRDLLDEKPPDAILVGFEPKHDRVFKQYAEERGYVEVEETFLKRGRLWIGPRVERF